MTGLTYVLLVWFTNSAYVTLLQLAASMVLLITEDIEDMRNIDNNRKYRVYKRYRRYINICAAPKLYLSNERNG